MRPHYDPDMAEHTPQTSVETPIEHGTSRVKRGMAEMLKGGVIMDVVTAEQAKIAEDAGAVAATVTVAQRIWVVRRQALERAASRG